MGLFGKAKKFVRGMAAEPPEPQAFRVSCPEGHIIRGRRTEGYQAIRCPECGTGVFVLPQSPLPMPPAPATRAEQAAIGTGPAVDDAPIPLADHDPDVVVEEGEVEWLEPVEPGTGLSGEMPTPAFDPVDAAVSELPEGREVSDTPRSPRSTSTPRPGPRPGRSSPASGRDDRARTTPPRGRPQPSRPAPPAEPRIYVPERFTLRERLRKNRLMLVGLAVAVVVLGTVAFSIYRNARRDYPAMVQQARQEGIPALDQGDFDRAYRLLSRGSEAVDALGGEIGGAEQVRQASREAAIFVDLIPDRLETILEERARTVDENQWQSTFSRRYEGRSVLISAQVTGTPATSGRFEINYLVLNQGTLAPRLARFDFEGFRLFEAGSPRIGTQLQFGARLAAIEAEEGGYRIRLRPESGVTITHVDALAALGWTPIETAAPAVPAAGARIAPPSFSPIVLATLLTPLPMPMAQDLEGQTREQVLEQLGAPRSYARSASQGEFVEQWVYDGPGGAVQYINFLQSTSRSGPAVVRGQFFLR